MRFHGQTQFSSPNLILDLLREKSGAEFYYAPDWRALSKTQWAGKSGQAGARMAKNVL
jgi:hypothetical protein